MKNRTSLFLLLAGAGDACTGVMLLFAPVWTLKLMMVADLPPDTAYIRFIGAFVFSFGTSYLRPFLHPPGPARAEAMVNVLAMTAWVRVCIATFSAVAILTGVLHRSWISVPLFDATLAVTQLLMLRVLRRTNG